MWPFVRITEALLDRFMLRSAKQLSASRALCWRHEVVGRRDMHWQPPNVHEWKLLGEVLEAILPLVEVLKADIRGNSVILVALLVMNLILWRRLALERVANRPQLHMA